MAEISVVCDDIDAAAKDLQQIGDDYGRVAISASGGEATATGHVELAEAITALCDQVSDVINGLVGELVVISDALTETAVDMRDVDDQAADWLPALGITPWPGTSTSAPGFCSPAEPSFGPTGAW